MAQTKLNVVEDTIENQISELRSQIATLTKSVSNRASEFSESDLVEDAKSRVSRAAQNVRDQSYNVVEAVKENPGTATSVLTVVGAIGFGLGYLLATSSQQSNTSSLYRWR
jgi:ElaB/YqjD/DUF883 family membrane-anchored ribosome-binding protein